MDAYQQQMDQYADGAVQAVTGAGHTLLKLLQSLAETGYDALRKFGEDRKAKEKSQDQPEQANEGRKFSFDQVARNQAAFMGFNNIFRQESVPVQETQDPIQQAVGGGSSQSSSTSPTAEKPDYQKILDQIVQTMKDTGATMSVENLIDLAENYTYEQFMGLVEDGLAGFEFNQEQEMNGPEINLTKLCQNQEVNQDQVQENAIDVTEIDDIKLSDCIGTPLCFAVPDIGMVAVDIGIGENGLEISAKTMDGLHELKLTLGEEGAQMDINALGGVIKGEIQATEHGHIKGDVQAFGNVDLVSADIDLNGQANPEVTIGGRE